MHWIRGFFKFFASRSFWILVGLLALSLFIWFAGPLFAFAEYRPLAPERVRWWCIGTLQAHQQLFL